MPKVLRTKPATKPFNGSLTRAFAGSPTSVDAETASFTVVMVTDTPVRRVIQDPRDPAKELVVDEVIVPAGVDMSRTLGMPLVDGHKTDGGIERILGKVDNVHLENGQIVGDATLASSHEHLISDIQRGFYRQGSIGYDVLEAELIEREDDVPLFSITRCLITEYSLVAVGADENSFIRTKSDTPHSPQITFRAAGKKQENTMTLKRGKRGKREDVTVDTDELEAMITAVEDAIADLGDDASEELIERARNLRGKRDEDEDEHQEERKRSKRDDDEDEPKAEDERKRSKRADDDEELTEDEQDEYEDIRSIARSYGLGKLVSDMRALGSRPTEAKRALRKAISERGATHATAKDIEVRQPSKRAADTKTDTTAIYAARRAR